MPVSAGEPFAFLDRHWRWFLLLFWLVDRRLHALRSAGPRSASSRSATPTTICGSCRSAPCSTARAGTISPSTGWPARATSTGRGWSTCRSPALKLLLHAARSAARIAEQIAVAVAPLLPMLVAMAAIARDRAAAGRADRLSARHRPARLRRLGRRHVAAAADRPSWLAARLARLGDGLADRSEARARRRHARPRHRLVARDRAGDAALSRRRRRARRADVGARRRRGAAARRLRRQPRRRLRLRLPRLHLRGEHGAALRRADAGLAVGDARRRRGRGRARLC